MYGIAILTILTILTILAILTIVYHTRTAKQAGGWSVLWGFESTRYRKNGRVSI